MSLNTLIGRILAALALLAMATAQVALSATPTAPVDWADDLRPIAATDWNRARAAHLLARAGFGATPTDLQRSMALGAQATVAGLVRPGDADDPAVGAFQPSGIPDDGIDPFPESRPLATDNAKARGEAIGVQVKPTGNRRLQPVVDKFFFWLRASALECNRINYWWARDQISPAMRQKLGAVPRANRYALAPLLETIFLSRDFYSAASVGTRIKGPVELLVSTYRKLGLTSVPGLPDFNETTRALGQHLLHPPTVAGWSQGRAWITPGLLIERGNFVRDLMFPDFMAVANDRYPLITVGAEVRAVHERISRGLDVTAATRPEAAASAVEGMSQASRMLDREEDFNTRYGSYRGWQKAVEVIKPIPRTLARVDLSAMVLAGNARTTAEAVELLVRRFFTVPPGRAEREAWTAFLTQELGTDQIERAQTYMEDGLRLVLHLLLSSPDYQLG